jgi:hypothetical protein
MVPWWYVETCRNYIQERTRLRHYLGFLLVLEGNLTRRNLKGDGEFIQRAGVDLSQLPMDFRFE